jgi:hypothetical protein
MPKRSQLRSCWSSSAHDSYETLDLAGTPGRRGNGRWRSCEHSVTWVSVQFLPYEGRNSVVCDGRWRVGGLLAPKDTQLLAGGPAALWLKMLRVCGGDVMELMVRNAVGWRCAVRCWQRVLQELAARCSMLMACCSLHVVHLEWLVGCGGGGEVGGGIKTVLKGLQKVGFCS